MKFMVNKRHRFKLFGTTLTCNKDRTLHLYRAESVNRIVLFLLCATFYNIFVTSECSSKCFNRRCLLTINFIYFSIDVAKSIANVFFFEVPTLNRQCSAVHQMFAAQMNAVHSALGTRPHQHFSHLRMPHSAFTYRCGCDLTSTVCKL